MTSFVERPLLLYPATLALAVVCGLLTNADPRIAVGLVAVAILFPLAWSRPVGNLIAIVLLTAVVPYAIQKLVGVSRPGVLLSDVLLMIGLAWGILAAASASMERRWRLFATGLALYLAVVVLQLIHGLRAGYDISEAGYEARIQLGFATFFLAGPLIRDPETRQKLLKGLLVSALILGVWGIYQYVGKVPFSTSLNFGVREGVSLTTSGRGQVQGGLYGFGVAVIMCSAALLSGNLSARARRWVAIALALNVVSLLLTFERTFWVATVVCLGLVIVRGGRVQRLRALILVPLAVVSSVVLLSLVAPRELTTARERLLSIGQAAQTDSIRYRLVESREVADEVLLKPLTGWGFGAQVYWGRPWQRVPPSEHAYSHDGYLWLVWKLGIPGGCLLLLLLAGALVLRGPPNGVGLDRALWSGAQSSILMLLIASATFPSFNTQSITAVMGVLLAMATVLQRRGRSPSPRTLVSE